MKIIFLILISSALVAAGNEENEPECSTPPASILCSEPTHQVVGFKSDFPLLTDASMQATCKNNPENVFKDTYTRVFWSAFSDEDIVCDDDNAITGLELCFQIELKYVIAHCRELQSNYWLNMDDVREAKNSSENPTEVRCPDDMAVVLASFKQDEDGNISVYLKCAAIENIQ